MLKYDMSEDRADIAGRIKAIREQAGYTQDEFAIATLLLDMEEYLNGGPSPYPLWEAIEDARFWLRLQEAVESAAAR